MASKKMGIETSDPYLLTTGGVTKAVKLKLLNHAAAYVHSQIRLWMNTTKGDVCWASHAALGEETGMSERSVTQHIKTLETIGFLHKIKRPGSTDLYRALDTPSSWSFEWGKPPKSVMEKAEAWMKLVEIDPPDEDPEVRKVCGPGPQDLRTRSAKSADDKKDIYINKNKKTKNALLQAASDEAASNDTPKKPAAETHPEAFGACEHLEQAILAHRKTHNLNFSRPKLSDGWVTDMDKLIRLGTSDRDVESEPVDIEKIYRVIDRVFEWFGEPSGNSDFCWASQIRSPKNLRKHWPKLIDALNTEHNRRSGRRPQRTTGNSITDLADTEKADLAKQLGRTLRAARNGGKPASPSSSSVAVLTTGASQ